MDIDTLLSIRKWYEDQLEPLKGSSGHSKVRAYIYERINQINMLIFSANEEDYLKALDALFLFDSALSKEYDGLSEKLSVNAVKTKRGDDGEEADFVFDLCSRSKGIQD